MMDLKNKNLEGELQKSLKRIKEFEKEKEQIPEKKENSEKKNEMEAIIQYLSMIILSKPNNKDFNQEETIRNVQNVCGDNFFKILQEVYLKINDYEFEAQTLKEKIKEQVKHFFLILSKNYKNLYKIDKISKRPNRKILLLKLHFTLPRVYWDFLN